MREFKFRAWHKVERCMLGMSSADHYGQEYQGEVFSWKNEGQHITIMQYTGMKDCEGVAIYDGDILRGYFGIPPISVTAKVTFSNSAFIVETDRTPRFCNLAEFISHLGGDIEVIGNIYETPELLE